MVGALQQRFLPGVDLTGVHLESAGRLRHRLVALDDRQGHFGLEGRAVFHSFLHHVPAPLHDYSRSGTLS